MRRRGRIIVCDFDGERPLQRAGRPALYWEWLGVYPATLPHGQTHGTAKQQALEAPFRAALKASKWPALEASFWAAFKAAKRPAVGPAFDATLSSAVYAVRSAFKSTIS